MRTIKIKNGKLKKILEERGVIFREMDEINKKLVELDKRRTALGYKMDRLKEKTSPIIDEAKPTFELGEFELVTRVLLEKDEPTVEIVDQVEEYKIMLRDKKEK
jgi:hypothetical protein